MSNTSRFIDLLMVGWDEKIQNEIILNMYQPINEIHWRMESLVKTKDIKTIHEITLRIQAVIGYYEQLCLKSFYLEIKIMTPKEDKPETNNIETFTIKEVEKFLDDIPQGTKPEEKEGDESEDEPIKRFHESMSIVKTRLDAVINDMKLATISDGKIYGFVSDMRNFIEFIYASMNITKNIKPDMEGLRESIKMNVVPLMVQRHIVKEAIPTIRRYMKQNRRAVQVEEGDVIIE